MWRRRRVVCEENGAALCFPRECTSGGDDAYLEIARGPGPDAGRPARAAAWAAELGGAVRRRGRGPARRRGRGTGTWACAVARAPRQPPFPSTATALADPARPPWFTSPLVFWLSSCLLLSWPLRLLVEYNTAYVHYQVTKLFGVNYEPPSSATPTSVAPSVGPLPASTATGGGASGAGAGGGGGGGGALSRGSTIDSADLDWTIRDNCAVVPSYSEALLMLPPQPPAPPTPAPAELQ
ncbi:SFRICE_032337, partial [Gryllus bimaculatus]